MMHRSPLRFSFLVLACLCLAAVSQAQGAKQNVSQNPTAESNGDHPKERNEWFYRGRLVRGKASAELRRRAYESKLRLRQQNAMAHSLAILSGAASLSSGTWIPLGPAPLASDASGNGTQDYHQVAGRATSVAIDPADPTGNSVYIGAAQGGVWKSSNAANFAPGTVTWTPLSDSGETLSISAIAIQPGNTDPSKSVVLAATGEADNSGDSYFGLGILRSQDGGATWNLISKANNGALSFSGLGGTRMAFGTAALANTVVSAMATTSEGFIDGAVTSSTTRGLYTSPDAGLSWTYDFLSDPGGATDATSATSVVYNERAGLFFAAIRNHGFYSSPDGIQWARLPAQPGGSALSSGACPPQSTSNNRGCPIYRGEITVVPGRKEMYAWYISFSASGSIVDGGIWQSLDGALSWTAISNTGISNCGDSYGCGVQQGSYDLELLAMADGSGTDLYAGAVNLYKCAITSLNPTCAVTPFMNLTHVYGCVPIAAPAHVHPDQHALAAMIPGAGSDSGNALLYFANDGGIYRALNGYSGLNSGSCSGTNQFDDLNQNLGSLTQFVSFSQHPTDPNTLLGGTQDNGSPATSQATSTMNWGNVLGGDGGYNAIDPTATSNWYAANPDLPPGGLGIQLCAAGVKCNNSGFNFVVTSADLEGDDGAFYFPYILDPRSSTAMVIGTCRLWRGPRTGGVYTVLSPNFETLGSGTCTGDEVNQVQALAVGGPTNTDGSDVIYATTSGLGPLEGPLVTPSGGHVWVTKDASAGITGFSDATGNGPTGSINPNQFPISGVAVDSSDLTGSTAYVTVMGFTGGAGHVWKTTNAGATWSDFTANLPDSPANAVVVYPPMAQIYVATDVGVFASSTTAPNWTELGPVPSTNQAGFLPNVAVTALAVFASGGQQLLRASTYGRGMWQFNLVITPDFQVSISNSPQTVFTGQTATFNGFITALNGYASSVTLSCVAGTTPLPNTCSPSPGVVNPTSKTPFTLSSSGVAGDYNFSLKAAGSDTSHLIHTVPVTLHLVSFGMTPPSPAIVTSGRGTTSPAVSFQITAAGAFSQSVTVSCSSAIPNATCNLTPDATVTPTATAPVSMTASVNVPAATAVGNYAVTLQATTAGAPSPLTSSFTLAVISNPDFILSEIAEFPEVNAGSNGTSGPILIASQDGFSGTVALACASTYGVGSCSISPASVSSFPSTVNLVINGTSFVRGAYSLSITGTSGSIVHNTAVSFNVGDYSIRGPQTVTANPGAQVSTTLQLTSSYSYAGKVNATCDSTALPGAMCLLSPVNPFSVASGGTTNLTVTVNVPRDAIPGIYGVKINTQDTTGAPSHSNNLSLTITPDFIVTSSTLSQSVKAGQTSGAYNLTVQPVGSSFTGAVTLGCAAGLPPQGQCKFSPATAVTPGSSAVDVVMSISTVAAARQSTAELATRSRWFFVGLWLALPGIVLAAFGPKNLRARKGKSVISLLIAILALIFLPACGGVSTGGGSNGTSNPVTYHITVTGSSPGTAPDAGQSVVIALVVN